MRRRTSFLALAGITITVGLVVHLRGAALGSVGHLVLGSGFDPRDLAAYGVGVGLAALLEWATRQPI